MKIKNLRFNQVDIYNENSSLSLEDVIKFNNFIQQNKNLDLPLSFNYIQKNIKANYNYFYNIISLIRSNCNFLGLKLFAGEEIDSDIINFIGVVFDFIYIYIDDVEKMKNEVLEIIAKNENKVIILYEINENNIHEFSDFIFTLENVLKLRNFFSLKFDFNFKAINRKEYVISVLRALKENYSNQVVSSVLNEYKERISTYPPKERWCVLKEDKKAYNLRYNEPIFDVGSGEFFHENFENIPEVFKNYCQKCSAFSFCKGGEHEIMIDKSQQEVYCSIMSGIGYFTKQNIAEDCNGV